MAKFKSAKISSKVFAKIIEIEHEKVTRAYANIVYTGLVSGKEMRSTPGPDSRLNFSAEIEIDIRGVVGIAAALGVRAGLLVGVMDHWQEKQEELVAAERKRRPERQPSIEGVDRVRAMFADSGFMQTLKTVDIPSGEYDCPRLGFRVVIEDGRQLIIIGCACKPIAALATKAAIKPRDVAKTLMNIDGAYKCGTRRFDGFCTKSVAIPLKLFMLAVEPAVQVLQTQEL